MQALTVIDDINSIEAMTLLSQSCKLDSPQRPLLFG